MRFGRRSGEASECDEAKQTLIGEHAEALRQAREGAGASPPLCVRPSARSAFDHSAFLRGEGALAWSKCLLYGLVAGRVWLAFVHAAFRKTTSNRRRVCRVESVDARQG